MPGGIEASQGSGDAKQTKMINEERGSLLECSKGHDEYHDQEKLEHAKCLSIRN